MQRRKRRPAGEQTDPWCCPCRRASSSPPRRGHQRGSLRPSIRAAGQMSAWTRSPMRLFRQFSQRCTAGRPRLTRPCARSSTGSRTMQRECSGRPRPSRQRSRRQRATAAPGRTAWGRLRATGSWWRSCGRSARGWRRCCRASSGSSSGWLPATGAAVAACAVGALALAARAARTRHRAGLARFLAVDGQPMDIPSGSEALPQPE
mmetsp:Transcript_68319/g.181575  ORF Transcript_68319/g.181575 Transcript_68319/m.181575 type:complete len:205 (-) Transcript_68319:4-618(-)